MRVGTVVRAEAGAELFVTRTKIVATTAISTARNPSKRYTPTNDFMRAIRSIIFIIFVSTFAAPHSLNL